MEKYQYGEDDAGVERKPGWGIKSDAQVRLAMEWLEKLNVQKLTVRNDNNTNVYPLSLIHI